ncbi:MAG: pyridoxamine 5'-phosphate oxidase family protein [Actinomycetota bacterium]|nr:pyridoxamine 5'-phosphate oxidase family protein [Actinomycetota bacterium]
MNATGHETASTDTSDDVVELAERLEGIRFAMVTLPDAVGDLHGRPLTVQDTDFDGTLWFLVSKSADWTSAATGGVAANAAFNDEKDGRWVSVSGSARLVEDRERIRDMWSPLYEAWFDGVDDPDLVLLRLDAHSADYWDADANKIVRLARLVKSAVTGGDDDTGERGTLHTA